MNARTWVAETLSRTGAPFAKLRHPRAFTAQQLAERERVSGKRVCKVGAEPPLRAGMEVVMDRSMEVDGDIVFSAGTHEEAIRMPFKDWFHLVEPRVERFAVEPGRP